MINDLIETRDGSYLIATNGGGIGRFEPAAQPSVRFTSLWVGKGRAARVNALHEDAARRVWAGTDDGLFVADSAANGEFRGVALPSPGPDRFIASLCSDREGRLWIGGRRELWWRTPDGQIEPSRLEQIRGDVIALLADREGRLWVGQTDNRLLVLRAPSSAGADARMYTQADGLGAGMVMALFQSSDGRIWAGTDGGGLTEFANGTVRTYSKAQGLSAEAVRAIAEDEAGNLWIGQTDGAAKWSRQGFVTYGQPDGLVAGHIFAIFEGPAGELCVLQRQSIVRCLEAGRFRPVPVPVDRGRTYEPWWQRPLRDHRGEWWFPTSAGLYRFPKVGRLQELQLRGAGDDRALGRNRCPRFRPAGSGRVPRLQDGELRVSDARLPSGRGSEARARGDVRGLQAWQ